MSSAGTIMEGMPGPDATLAPAVRPAAGPPFVLEIVVPVYNEERQLAPSIHRLRSWLDASFPVATLVTIADNASTDATWDLALGLAAGHPGVRAVRLEEKGRGRALRAVWQASTAEVVAYMDVDLATGLDALLPLIAPLLSGHSDVAIGTRLARSARVERGTKREATSRIYNLIVHLTMRSGFSDAQCGFKAVRADVARALLPLVEDNNWFFDTELLVLAERNGLRIHEVPVDWVDDPDSSVHVAGTAVEDLAGLLRLFVGLAAGRGQADVADRRRGDLRRYAGVGIVSTVVWLVLFLLLRPALHAYGADALALLVCSTGAALFQWRFAIHRDNPVAAATVGAIGLAISLVLTVAALLVVTSLGARSELAEVVALLVATAAAALLRVLAGQAWVLRHRSARAVPA
jgi:glycosyltransferase involved in cell wall biosynthesis